MRVVDDCTLRISAFNYDGLGPDVWVLGGSSNAPAALKTNRKLEPIPRRSSGYSGAEFNVVLSGDVTFDLLAGVGDDASLVITVYCVAFAAEFGSATLKRGTVAPTTAPRALCNDWVGASGTIKTLAHDFAGRVSIKADCSLQIDGAVYDGRGPGAYFLFGPNNRELDSSSFRIPERATRAFDDECFPLSLPIDTAWETLANGTGAVKFGLYCVPFKQLFGEVVLTKPASPPADAGPRARCVAANGCPTRVPQCLTNCAMLSDNVNVWWQTSGDEVTVELEAEVDAGSWVAFGVSETGAMLGADVTVTGFMNEKPQAIDYYLTEYSQCNYAAGATSGVCPDNNLVSCKGLPNDQNDKKGRSDVTLVSGERVASVQRVRYRRKLDTGDVCDRAITAASKFVFGTGSITADPQRIVVNKHAITPKSMKLDLLSTPGIGVGCLAAPQRPQALELKCVAKKLVTGVKEFFMSVENYETYPNPPSWGVSWHWMENATAMHETPEIVVERGTKYKFTIAAGETHPFYIVDNEIGGRANTAEKVLAGDATAWGTEDKPYVLEWTPDDKTPATVYYQCWTHQKLGWRIYVVDAGKQVEVPKDTATICINGKSPSVKTPAPPMFDDAAHTTMSIALLATAMLAPLAI